MSLRTGEGGVIGEGPGIASVGLKSDNQGRLFVAGGTAGTARVVDSSTGDLIADYALTTGVSFVNDVVLTTQAAWFTDSAQPQLYRVDLGDDGAPGTESTVALTGEWVQGDDFGANGISTTPTSKALLVVNSTTGLLYRVQPATAVATEVHLGGASLTNGDGMLRHGRLRYVVRNAISEIAVIQLDKRGSSSELVRTITSKDLDKKTSFDVPTTVARFGENLYLPNARFSTTPTPATDYWVTKVRGGRR